MKYAVFNRIHTHDLVFEFKQPVEFFINDGIVSCDTYNISFEMITPPDRFYAKVADEFYNLYKDNNLPDVDVIPESEFSLCKNN